MDDGFGGLDTPLLPTTSVSVSQQPVTNNPKETPEASFVWTPKRLLLGVWTAKRLLLGPEVQSPTSRTSERPSVRPSFPPPSHPSGPTQVDLVPRDGPLLVPDLLPPVTFLRYSYDPT